MPASNWCICINRRHFCNSQKYAVGWSDTQQWAARH